MLREYERPFRRDFSYISFSILALMAVWVAASFVISLVAALISPQIIQSPLFSMLCNDVALYLLALPVFLLIASKVKAEKPIKRRLSAGKWFVILIICIGAMYAGSMLSSLLMEFVSQLLGRQPTNMVDQLINNSPIWLIFVFTVVIAPIGEEFIFRKCLCDRLRHYGELPAVIISALMFAGFHGNLFQFFYAFILGAIFAHVYLKTGRLRYTVLLHAVINFIGGIVPWILNKQFAMQPPESINEAEAVQYILDNLVPYLVTLGYNLLIIGCSVAALVLLICLRKRITFEYGKVLIPPSRVASVMVGNVGTILLIIGYFLLIIESLFV